MEASEQGAVFLNRTKCDRRENEWLTFREILDVVVEARLLELRAEQLRYSESQLVTPRRKLCIGTGGAELRLGEQAMRGRGWDIVFPARPKSNSLALPGAATQFHLNSKDYPYWR